MTHSEARKTNAMRRIKRILIDVEASIAKNGTNQRTCEMLNIKDILKRCRHE